MSLQAEIGAWGGGSAIFIRVRHLQENAGSGYGWARRSTAVQAAGHALALFAGRFSPQRCLQPRHSPRAESWCCFTGAAGMSGNNGRY